MGVKICNMQEYVCHLHKAIYVLKQAPRVWFDKFTNYLLEYGFVCKKVDHLLSVYHQNGQTMVMLLYVDGIILTGNDSTLVQSLTDDLSDKFSMKDSESLNYFLGIQVQRNNDRLFLSQTKYAEDIMHNASMAACKPMPTPFPLQHRFRFSPILQKVNQISSEIQPSFETQLESCSISQLQG